MIDSNKSLSTNSNLKQTSKVNPSGDLLLSRRNKGLVIETGALEAINSNSTKGASRSSVESQGASVSIAKKRAQEQIRAQQMSKAIHNAKVTAQKKAQAEARKRKALGLDKGTVQLKTTLVEDKKESSATQNLQAREKARSRMEYTKAVRAKRKLKVESSQSNNNLSQAKQEKKSSQNSNTTEFGEKSPVTNSFATFSQPSSNFNSKVDFKSYQAQTLTSNVEVASELKLRVTASPQPKVKFNDLSQDLVTNQALSSQGAKYSNSTQPRIKQNLNSSQVLQQFFSNKATTVSVQPRVRGTLTGVIEADIKARQEADQLVSNLLTLTHEDSGPEDSFLGLRSHQDLNQDLEAAGKIAVSNHKYRSFNEELTIDKEKEAADKQASFENGTINSDYISPSDLKKKRASTRGNQEIDKQKLIQQQRKTVFARLAYLNNEYGIKDYNKPLSLLKVLYKDLSKSLFWTFFLLLSLLFTSLGRIYLSKVVRDDIITYSHYLKDSRVLTSSTKNLTLEKVYLTSQYYLLDNANKLNMHPQDADKEILIVIPKISDAKVLPLTNLNPGLLQYLDLDSFNKKLDKK